MIAFIIIASNAFPWWCLALTCLLVKFAVRTVVGLSADSCLSQ